MATSELMPDLQLVPTGRIRFHEHPERRRTLRLVERIRKEEILRNPPIVAGMGNGDFLLLDGANRVSAFSDLEFSHIPVQVVDYAHDEIELKGWHHLLVSGSALNLRSVYKELDGVGLKAVEQAELAGLLKERAVYAVLVDETATCWALLPGGERAKIEMHERISILEQVIAAYEGQSRLERIKLADFSQLPEVLHTVEHQLCLFPVLEKPELLQLAAEGVMIPTGITRHLIPGRALGLNIELGFIRNLKTDAEKIRHFEDYVAGLEMEGRIRFYEESVFVMNE